MQGLLAVPIRNLSLLFLSYPEASISCNPLTRSAVSYLLTSQAHFSEGQELHIQPSSLRARVQTHPFPHLHDATVHSDSFDARPLLNVLWVITDCTITASALGGGVILFQPPTANHQPPPTTNGDQLATANHCQPPPTTNHQPPTAANPHQPPPTANCRQPPTANRQRPWLNI